MKRICAWVLACACIMLICSSAFALEEEPRVGASGAILLDVQTARVLADRNAHQKLPMASTTKVMTALIALEYGKLDEIVTVPASAYGVEGSSMYLNKGEKVSLEDLLYGLMLVSGNDAAIAIAEHIGGSVENFARMMNERAREIGCVNTNFVTPNGLPDPNHYTTAYDLGLIAATAMRNPEFRTIVGTTYHQTTTGDVKRTLKNKNKILWQYDGGNGVKTGFTKAAGRCLVFSAQRDGHDIVGVVLNCPDMWNDAMALLNYGFDAYEWKEYVTAGSVIRQVPVEQGMKNNLEVVAKRSILIPVKRDVQEDIQLRVICPQVLQAPVLIGQTVGSLEVHADGKVLASTPLVSAKTVLRKDYMHYLWRIIQQYTA